VFSAAVKHKDDTEVVIQCRSVGIPAVACLSFFCTLVYLPLIFDLEDGGDSSSETSVPLKTTGRDVPEDSEIPTDYGYEVLRYIP
jgi:hypothetical protein